MNYCIHTDGGSRGNPGKAAVGVVIEELGERGKGKGESKMYLVAAFGKKIGETTNNVAEYTAVIEALKWMIHKLETRNSKLETQKIEFFLDSMLVVNQLNGVFKVKDQKMRELLVQVRVLEQEVGGVITYTSIPREENVAADFEVNKALDEKLC